jgi:sulfate permease, SulP family
VLAKPAAGVGIWVGAAAVAAAVWVTGRRHEPWPAALVIVLGGAAFALITYDSGGISLTPDLWRPTLERDAFAGTTLWSALTLLVIPQIPLTLGNAVVAVTDVERRYFGTRAARVTPARISLECGLANIASGTLGGIPMCHGSGGLTAHFRAGARTARMNLVIGVPLLALGLLFAPAALDILALVPLTVLVGLLALNGVTHALLVRDQSGYDLAISITMGMVGLITANLAWSLALGLAMYWSRAAVGSAARTA